MARCKNCNEKFIPKVFNSKYCSKEQCQDISIKLILNRVRVIKRKKWTKDKREIKERLRTNADWLKDAQKVVNKYIRIRDKDELNCISCGKQINGVRHASHYLSAGHHTSVRFNTDNIWVSCYKCNIMLSGNQIEYRIRLIKKIGIKRVEHLERISNEIKRYSILEIKDLIKEFKVKIKLLYLKS